jgi:hypothetical protein
MFYRNNAARTSNPARSLKRTLAGFCTAVLAGAALVLLPALPATADEATDALVAAADAAESAAFDADAVADAAEAAAVAAADEAIAQRGLSDAAAATLAEAAAALAALPDDPVTQAAFAAAEALALEADAVADAADLASADAAAVALSERANADALAAAAIEARAAADAALGVEEEEVVEPDADATQKIIINPCDLGVNSFTQENKDSWKWCVPEPDIDIYVKNVCPTEVLVKISNLIKWGDYEVWVNGVKHEIDIDWQGKAEFKVTDFESGRFEVKIKYGHDKYTKEDKWIKADCPWVKTEVEHECKTIGGTAEVEVKVGDLEVWREYKITVTGPNGYSEYFNVSWSGWWKMDLDLEPGAYTVTVESKDHYKPHVGPVTYNFDVAPCPGEVVITITPVCAASGSGSLGAVLSGLVIGREYHVTVEGPTGIVTDTTFDATSTSWAVPPANLPPGTYTVTVVDTHSHASYNNTLDQDSKKPREHKPLTWTATGTISSCPQLQTLAATGSAPTAPVLAGLLLLPIGGGLLVARSIISRRREVHEAE